MSGIFINIGCLFAGTIISFVTMAIIISGRDDFEANFEFYKEIASLKKRLYGSYKGIKYLKRANNKLKGLISLQETHIDALREISDGLINGQESVEKACNKIVVEMGKEFSTKIEHIKKNNRHEIRQILDEVAGKEQYIRDLEAQNKNLYELLENSRAVNDKKNLKEVA